jgi:hypothetical protein
MFELILTATKRDLGRNYLLDLLKSENPDGNDEKQTLHYQHVLSDLRQGFV